MTPFCDYIANDFCHFLESVALKYHYHSPSRKFGEVWVGRVCPLPRQDAEGAEEDDDAVLENILDPIHLVVLVGVFRHLGEITWYYYYYFWQ